ncbi:hypothetical protein VMCG_07885 [Cytospora schulzeri]|uniref:Extracellular membrane protein CFEM domain-containing protein n=1 Tax=Cytospora schulzeri TaxID=448051 RepID=A0A423W099_9PEZI|nr:hypothetical protein VMCG_07885 [Valsa malicola]
MKCTTLLTLALGSLAAGAAIDSSNKLAERSCTSDCIAEGRPPTLCASLCSKRAVDVDLEVQKRGFDARQRQHILEMMCPHNDLEVDIHSVNKI